MAQVTNAVTMAYPMWLKVEVVEQSPEAALEAELGREHLEGLDRPDQEGDGHQKRRALDYRLSYATGTAS
jgi:hypothetical protein